MTIRKYFQFQKFIFASRLYCKTLCCKTKRDVNPDFKRARRGLENGEWFRQSLDFCMEFSSGSIDEDNLHQCLHRPCRSAKLILPGTERDVRYRIKGCKPCRLSLLVSRLRPRSIFRFTELIESTRSDRHFAWHRAERAETFWSIAQSRKLRYVFASPRTRSEDNR